MLVEVVHYPIITDNVEVSPYHGSSMNILVHSGSRPQRAGWKAICPSSNRVRVINRMGSHPHQNPAMAPTLSTSSIFQSCPPTGSAKLPEFHGEDGRHG